VAESHTIPTGALWVVFSSNCNFYANPSGTAAVPSDDVTDGTGAELNPAAWRVIGLTAVSLIATTACVVTMSYYK
jgi:hypothetical protein